MSKKNTSPSSAQTIILIAIITLRGKKQNVLRMSNTYKKLYYKCIAMTSQKMILRYFF